MLSDEPGSVTVKAMMNQPTAGETKMAYNNTVTLIGNLGEDPKTYSNKNGTYVRLNLATTDSYKNKTGAWVSRKPVWHTVFVSSKKLQEMALQYKKGNRIKITGGLSYRRIKATDKGHMQTFTQATISAYRIEDATLQPKASNNTEGNAA